MAGAPEGNKNAEKWTEKKAIDFGNKLLAWMKSSEDNIFFKKFCHENDIYQTSIDYLCGKYELFSNLIKKAKDIQQQRLIDRGLEDKYPTFEIFLLKACHGLQDKQQIDLTTQGEKIQPQIIINPPKDELPA